MPVVTDPASDAALFELLTTPAGRADPYPIYQRIRDRAPVLRSAAGPIVLTGYRDCLAALRNPKLGRGLVGPNAARNRARMPGAADPELRSRYFDRGRNSMLFTDPPAHTRLRRLVSRAFTPKRIDELRPSVVATVDAILDRIGERDEVDVIAELAFPLPVSVVGQLVGVPAEDRPSFQPLVRASTAGLEPFVDDAGILAALAAQDQMHAYFTHLLASRRRNPAGDLLSGLAQAREHDDALTDDEIVSTSILLFAAGFETTTNLIGNGLLALLHNPGQFDRLRRDPGLAPSAVEEILRFDSPVQVNSRTALEPAEIAGEPVQPGQVVMVLQGAANRDPEQFPDPDRLDLGRRDNSPLSFGWGIHHCLGAALARMEGEVVFRALADRFASVELAAEDVPRRPSLTLRGVTSLPVRLGAARPQRDKMIR
jgi:cytochrome P450